MLELRSLPADVLGCFARPQALDKLAEAAGISVRVAPDELILLGEGDRIASVEAQLNALDSACLVTDLSGGFSIWALRGESRFEAFCRLSAIELPRARGVAQGLVAHVPTKVVVRDDELLLLVSSALAHHVRQRVLVACADLSARKERVVEEAVLA